MTSGYLNKMPVISNVMKNIPFVKDTEYVIKKYGVIFSIIVIMQGLLGGMHFDPPRRLRAFTDNAIVKFVLMFSIALTASRDIETALMSTLIFIFFIYLVRDPDEQKFPY